LRASLETGHRPAPVQHHVIGVLDQHEISWIVVVVVPV
jgi:hypothetical protein